MLIFVECEKKPFSQLTVCVVECGIVMVGLSFGVKKTSC